MQVLHKVTASASAESSSEEEKGDVMTSPHRQTSALRIFTPAPSPLTGKTIMTGRKKPQPIRQGREAVMTKSRFLCKMHMDSAIFKSDIEIKYPPQNKWPFKKKKSKVV